MRVVFFGTPPFAADVLNYLLKHHIEIAAVITKPDRAQGRSGSPVPTAVKAAALAYMPPIPLYQPEIVSAPEFAPVLEQYNADLFVVVAYGEIIKQHLLDMPKAGCINLHASLLPKYRGAAPIQRSILNGEQEAGITIIHMSKKMDAGDIIKMASTPIGSETTYGELERQLCTIGSQLLIEVIRDLDNKIVQRIPQDHLLATFAPKIELEECEVDWTKSAQAIHDLVRGVNPHPGAWCTIWIKGEKKRLKIFKTEVITNCLGLAGTLAEGDRNKLTIFCGGNALRLLEVQLEGKKAMKTEELVRGIPATNIRFKP